MGNSTEQLIAGALFDFAGFLTAMDDPVTFSSRHAATPAVELLSVWAAKRGLALDEASVTDWSATLRQPARVDEVMVDEGLDYFEKAGDDGDKLYVKAIREHIATLQAALAQHGHPDFIGANELLASLDPAPEEVEAAKAWVQDKFAAQPVEGDAVAWRDAAANVLGKSSSLYRMLCEQAEEYGARPAARVSVPEGMVLVDAKLLHAVRNLRLIQVPHDDAIMNVLAQHQVDELRALLTTAPAPAEQSTEALRRNYEQEQSDIDQILVKLGIGVERGRTEGGYLHVPRILNHIQETLDALASAPGFGAHMSDKYVDLVHQKAEQAGDYPECSGDPTSCPENEGYGCCKKHAASADGEVGRG